MFISKKKLQEMIQEEKDKVWEQVEEDRYRRESLDRLFRVEGRVMDLDKEFKFCDKQIKDAEKQIEESLKHLDKIEERLRSLEKAQDDQKRTINS